jgi:DNA mismatch repair protein MutL
LATGTAARARTETREGTVRVISQMFRTFFLAERGEEFWLVDQHTAHERVLYERLLGKGAPRPQRLVEPALVDLGAAERRVLDSNLQELESLGFQIEPFGRSTVKVGAVPSVFGRPTAAARLRDILDDLAEGAKLKDVDGPAERVRKSSACRSAWMKGDEVAPEEFAPVLKELLECRDPYRCPHGRPTIITLSRDWFEREFERK